MQCMYKIWPGDYNVSVCTLQHKPVYLNGSLVYTHDCYISASVVHIKFVASFIPWSCFSRKPAG